jgi:hypothetical protein
VDKVVGRQVSVVGRVLAHGTHPEPIVEGLAAEGDGLEEFGDVLRTISGGLVVVGCGAGQDGACRGRLHRRVPRDIWRTDVLGGLGHC